MISLDSSESIPKRRKQVKSKGRLVRSLEFAVNNNNNNKDCNNSSNNSNKKPTKSSSKQSSIWRDPIKNVIHPSGFTTHKMSSVTNNFMSSDLSSSSGIDEMVEDLVDPGSGILVFPQHDEVFRTSPLSNSSFINDETDDFAVEEATDDFVVNETTENNGVYNQIQYQHPHTQHPHTQHQHNHNQHDSSVGMSWNPKQNQWIPLIYRYIFPSSAFSVSSPQNNSEETAATATTWSIKNGNFNTSSSPSTRISFSFTFPPPKKSIMMGPAEGFILSKSTDSDARDVCEKLLELMDDENLMLPVVKTVYGSVNNSSPPPQYTHTHTTHSAQHTQQNNQKSLLSEWSSLPSSPPPPIFHDVCNRPIPELRLSPPMSGKSIGKRLFPLNATINNYTTTNPAVNNSPCESPLTKRLRFSSSSSSIS